MREVSLSAEEVDSLELDEQVAAAADCKCNEPDTLRSIDDAELTITSLEEETGMSDGRDT